MPRSASLPDADVIRQTAEDVIKRPAYRLEPPPEPPRALQEFLQNLLRWVITPFRWLFELLDGLPNVLRWLIVVGLAVVLIALVAHISYLFVRAIQGPRRSKRAEPRRKPVPLEPGEFEVRAEEAESREDWTEALRLLFQACLLRLARSREKPFRPGMTNREYLQYYRGTEIFKPMALLVEMVERKWYGQEACSSEEYHQCRQAHSAICHWIRESAHHAHAA